MTKIRSFRDYINEQENKPAKKEGETNNAGNDAALLAKAMMTGALDKLGFDDNDFSLTEETPETKKGSPYTACGNNAYTFIPSEGKNSQFIDMFQGDGEFARDAAYSELHKELSEGRNKIFLIGVREKIEIKRTEGDRFIDKIVIVDPSKPNDDVVSYQLTTCPSVVFYSSPEKAVNSKGVAILQPGSVKYKIGIHKKGSPTQHEALIQNGSMDIQRFPLNTKEITTYTPGTPQSGTDFGINIHRSSADRGVCVGPYSVGCQVFADGNDFDTFMKTMKGSTANNGEFIYALIQKDDIK